LKSAISLSTIFPGPSAPTTLSSESTSTICPHRDFHRELWWCLRLQQSSLFTALRIYRRCRPMARHPFIRSARRRRPERLILEQALGSLLAGFVAGAAKPYAESGLRYDVEFPPTFAPPNALAQVAITTLECKREFRPTPTTSSRASDLPLTRRAMVRQLSAAPTEFSSITRCLDSTSGRRVRRFEDRQLLFSVPTPAMLERRRESAQPERDEYVSGYSWSAELLARRTRLRARLPE